MKHEKIKNLNRFVFGVLVGMILMMGIWFCRIQGQRDAAETALRDCHAERAMLYRELVKYAPDLYKELVDSLITESEK